MPDLKGKKRLFSGPGVWAQEAYEPIGKRIIEKWPVALDPGHQDYVVKPLDWAPPPEGICRPLFTDDIIAAHL